MWRPWKMSQSWINACIGNNWYVLLNENNHSLLSLSINFSQVVPKITPETESNKWLSSSQSGLPWFDNANRTNVYLQSKLAFKEIKHFQTDSVGMLKDNYHIPLVPRYFMDFRIPGVRCYEKPTQIIVEDTPDEHTKDKEKPKFPERSDYIILAASWQNKALRHIRMSKTQTGLRSHASGQELPYIFYNISILCRRTVKILTRLRGCAGWSRSSLFAYVVRHLFSAAGPLFVHCPLQSF